MYDEFINNILETRGRHGCGDEYFETHHIIPKCLDGTNDEENLIDLFAREHFEAHRLLALENPNNEKLTYAWWMMATIKNEYQERCRINAEEYEEARIANNNIRQITMTGENAPMYGKHFSEETKKKMSESHKALWTESRRKEVSEWMKGRYAGEKNPFYGVNHSGENNPGHKKVIQYDLNGNFIKVWDYIKQAADELGINKADIVSCCKHKIGYAGKFIWEYYKDDFSLTIAPYKNKQAKKVVQYDLDRNFIKIWGSTREAERDTGIGHTLINKCCKGEYKTAGGFYWEYINSENIPCRVLTKQN